MNTANHLEYMKKALTLAEIAYQEGEVPVGAMVISPTGYIVSQAHNEKEYAHNPCGHAEIIALQKAGLHQNNWRLDGLTLYVTLEPCPMCLSAMIHARISQLVFGTYDSKGGALSLGYNLYKDKRLNHNFSVIGGILHRDCSRILSQFFKDRRKVHSK